MDDIDKLIRKYGAEKLITIIVQRLDHKAFFQSRKGPGAPRIGLGPLWGLRYVFHHYQEEFPHENQDIIANKILKFLRDYRHWLENSDIYSSNLALNKDLFDKISWLGNHGKKKITSKTILEKLRLLKKDHERVAKFTKAVVFNELDFMLYPPGWSDGDDLNNY